MKIAPFELERFFAKHEFSARYLLSSSDCQALGLDELLQLADSETRRLWDGLELGYTETTGHPLLREAIADLHTDISAEDVVVVVPEEGIFLSMHALLTPGDHVVCTFPGYQSLYEVARSIGCRVSTWEPDEKSGWRFSVERLEQILQPDTRLVVVNFPHNPTGYLPSREDFEKIVELVRQRGAYLLSDEMYRFLELDPATTLPSGSDLYDKAFSLFGMSKTFGLPGLRLGWITSRNKEALCRMAALKDYTTICASAPSEVLAIMALRSKQAIIDPHLDRIRRNLAVLDEFFAEYDDCFRWNRPKGGSICFPRLLTPQSADDLCGDLLETTGIMLVSSSQFQFGDRHVRVGFGRENLPEVIGRFSEYLNVRYRGTT